MDLDTDKGLSAKGHEKQDIVNQLRKDEKRGMLISNTSQSCGKIKDAQQGFDDSNDASELKTFDVQGEMIYSSVVELFPDGIFVLDLKGIVQSCNASAVTLLGYSKEEIIGQKFSDIGNYDAKGIATYLNTFDSIIQGNIIDPFELEFQKKDKTLFTAEMRMQLLTLKGKTMGIQVIARRISDIQIQEEKIRESKDSFQRIFSLIPDMISVHDLEMNIIYSNWKGFAAIPEEKRILNTKCYKTYRGLDHICPDCKARTVLNTKESIQEEIELPEGIWVDLRVLPLIDENNEVELFVEWVRDITQNKQTEQVLKESEKENRSIVEIVPDIIFRINKNGEYIDVKTSSEDELAKPKEDLLKKNIKDVFTSDVSSLILDTIRKAIATSKIQVVEYELAVPAGKKTFEGRILRHNEDEVIAFVRDITKRKQSEENLKQMHREVKDLNRSLEKKVVQRTERIKQLLEQKDEFINQLGHDLKNPLGPFIQLLPILENHISDEKDNHMIKVLSRNARYMQNLVKKTLDLAKLNASETTLSFEDVSLSDIVEEVVELNASLFDENDVVVENNVSTDCLVHVDLLHIEEVFTNLFNNAVKYSKDEKWIGVDAVEKDDYVLVSVHDKGIGISEEQLPYLFDEYYKVDSSRHDFDSSGLGLSISKRIIEKHGGRIWTESPGLGKGSTFYFTLPKKVN